MPGPFDRKKPPLLQPHLDPDPTTLHMQTIPENIANKMKGSRTRFFSNPIQEIKKQEGECQQPNPEELTKHQKRNP